MQRMDQDQPSTIELKLTYNRVQHMPRNFFIHLLHVPQNVHVKIEYDGQEIPVTNAHGQVDARFWIAPDTTVSITLAQEDAVLAFGQYLVHHGEIFEAIHFSKRISLLQVAY